MTSQREYNLFKVSGPTYLTSVNWSSLHDQRVVVASLVNASYLIEKDSVKRRVGPELLAPAWWQHFHFDCREVLRDVSDKSVIGCIYELKPPFSRHPSAPRVVVALRGTMLDEKHCIRDLWMDIRVIFLGGINKSTRCKTVLDAVQKLLLIYKPADIWLTGHSLGASIATVIGKYYAKTDDIYLNTFLFNPPFPSIYVDWFPHKKSIEEFLKVATWSPYLFVHPQDPISSLYIQYFKRRKKAEGTIKECMEQGAPLLPSARLVMNLKKCPLLECHGIHQWWQQDVSLKFDDYHYQLKNC